MAPGTLRPMARVEVSTDIAATPDQVWALIGDPTRMGEFSPECRTLAWRKGATAPAHGARFTGRNHNGWHRWSTTNTIVAYQPGRTVGWDVDYFGIPVAHWRYEIEAGPDGDSCRLVERFADRRSRAFAALTPFARGVRDVETHNRATMEQTLARIKSTAESETAPQAGPPSA